MSAPEWNGFIIYLHHHVQFAVLVLLSSSKSLWCPFPKLSCQSLKKSAAVGVSSPQPSDLRSASWSLRPLGVTHLSKPSWSLHSSWSTHSRGFPSLTSKFEPPSCGCLIALVTAWWFRINWIVSLSSGLCCQWPTETSCHLLDLNSAGWTACSFLQ